MPEQDERQTHELISELLKRKDPALVKVRKILRDKGGNLSSTKSFTSHSPEVFNLETKEKSAENESIFSDNELEEVKFSKEIALLENELRRKEAQIETTKREAFEQGKKEGIEQTQAEMKIKLAEIEEKIRAETQVWRVEQISQELNARNDYFKGLEDEVFDSVLAISKKILDTEISTNTDLILSVVKKALANISQRDGITIRVSKDDFEYVNSKISTFNRHSDGVYEINIKEDEHIQKGGCLIETASTIVDAQMEKRSKKVFDLIEKIWAESILPKPLVENEVEIGEEFFEENPETLADTTAKGEENAN